MTGSNTSEMAIGNENNTITNAELPMENTDLPEVENPDQALSGSTQGGPECGNGSDVMINSSCATEASGTRLIGTSPGFFGTSAQAVANVLTTVFVGTEVKVAQNYNHRKRAMMPPHSWNRSMSLIPLWCLPLRGNPGIDIDENNLEASRRRRIWDFAWMVAGVRSVKVASHAGIIRELVYIAWTPCWIPLCMMQESKSHPHFKETLEKARTVYETTTKKRQQQRGIYLHPTILSFMIEEKEEDWDLFYGYRVIEYAITRTEKAQHIEIIRTEFLQTYEHCSALANSWDLWTEVYKQRLAASQKLLKDLTLPEVDKNALTAYNIKSERNLSVLEAMSDTIYAKYHGDPTESPQIPKKPRIGTKF